MKNQVWGVIVMGLLVMLAIVTVYYYSTVTDYQSCVCLGQRPYIITTWNGDCVTTMVDVYGDYDGKGLVKYLFESLEECR